MKPANRRSIRRILGILLLVASLILLIWGNWPFQNITQSIQLQPSDMQLPLSDSFVPFIVWIV